MATPPKVDPPADGGLPSLEGRGQLTPAQIEALWRAYDDVKLADDDDAKALNRRIIARLRRCSHQELHPGCQRVIIDVPDIKVGSIQVNNRVYRGRHEVWMCEAQTILGLVQQAEAVEQARLREDGTARPENSYDLDRGGLAARARAIQSA